MAWRIGCLILANDLGLQENLQAFFVSGTRSSEQGYVWCFFNFVKKILMAPKSLKYA